MKEYAGHHPLLLSLSLRRFISHKYLLKIYFVMSVLFSQSPPITHYILKKEQWIQCTMEVFVERSQRNGTTVTVKLGLQLSVSDDNCVLHKLPAHHVHKVQSVHYHLPCTV